MFGGETVAFCSPNNWFFFWQLIWLHFGIRNIYDESCVLALNRFGWCAFLWRFYCERINVPALLMKPKLFWITWKLTCSTAAMCARVVSSVEYWVFTVQTARGHPLFTFAYALWYHSWMICNSSSDNCHSNDLNSINSSRTNAFFNSIF